MNKALLIAPISPLNWENKVELFYTAAGFMVCSDLITKDLHDFMVQLL